MAIPYFAKAQLKALERSVNAPQDHQFHKPKIMRSRDALRNAERFLERLQNARTAKGQVWEAVGYMIGTSKRVPGMSSEYLELDGRVLRKHTFRVGPIVNETLAEMKNLRRAS